MSNVKSKLYLPMAMLSLFMLGCNQDKERCGTSVVVPAPATQTSTSGSSSTGTSSSAGTGARGLFTQDDYTSGCPADAANYSSNIPNHVKYFGFYGLAADGIGQTEDISAVKEFSNLIYVKGNEIYKLEQIKKINVQEKKSIKAMVSVTDIFFDSQLNLYPDYSARWNNWATQIKPYSDVIAAFYAPDDQFQDEEDFEQNIPDMLAKQVQVNQAIKSITNIPIAVVFSTKFMASEDFQILPNYDWVAFQCYGSWKECGEDEKSIPEYYGKLKARMHSGQKTFVVSDAMAVKDDLDTKSDYAKTLIEKADTFYQLCNNDLSCVADIAFVYRTFKNKANDTILGATEFTGVIPKYTEIGKRIVAYMKALEEEAKKQSAATSNDDEDVNEDTEDDGDAVVTNGSTNVNPNANTNAGIAVSSGEDNDEDAEDEGLDADFF